MATSPHYNLKVNPGNTYNMIGKDGAPSSKGLKVNPGSNNTTNDSKNKDKDKK